MNHFNVNPYRVIVSGIMIPPFSSISDEFVTYSESSSNGILEKYAIVLCLHDIAYKLMFPEIVFAPKTMGIKILMPIFLNAESDSHYNERLVPKDGSILYARPVTATRNISLVKILGLEEHITEIYPYTEPWYSSFLRYLVATRLEVKTRINARSLTFLKGVKSDSKVNYRGLTFYVDYHAENADEMLEQVRYSLSFVSTLFTRYVTMVVMYARNNLFVNASNPLPFSNSSRYTVARIGCNEEPMNLLLINWDDDIYSPHPMLQSLSDLL